MAADLAGAEALLAASRAAGQPLMVNWPTAWRPAIRHGLTLVRSGAVGQPVQLSHRGGHAGPREFGCSPQFCDWLYDPARNGGGALVDYCGYGAILCHAILGRPAAVTAVSARLRKEDLPAEDNAIVILRYPRALAVLEASWTQIGGEPAFGMIVYGDAGTVLVHQPRLTREGQRVAAGQVQLVTRDGSQWIEPPPLPADEQRRPDLLPVARPRRPPRGGSLRPRGGPRRPGDPRPRAAVGHTRTRGPARPRRRLSALRRAGPERAPPPSIPLGLGGLSCQKGNPIPKVIAVTAARGRFNRLTAARHVGAHHTLVKPFGMTDLLTAVRDVLAG